MSAIAECFLSAIDEVSILELNFGLEVQTSGKLFKSVDTSVDIFIMLMEYS